MRSISWSLAALALLVGCSDEQPRLCDTDDDCREGYTCDHDQFAGECVSRVLVVPCGAVFCRKGEEACVSATCVPLSELGPRPDARLPTLRDGGHRDVGVDARPPRADAAPDGSAAVPEPQVVIDAPNEGQLFVEEAPVLRGRVVNAVPQTRARFTLEATGSAEPPRTTDLALAPDGRFRAALDVAPGLHRVTLTVEQGEHPVEIFVNFRFDAFVEAGGGAFRLMGEQLRFVGLDAPRLREAVFAWQIAGRSGRDPADLTFEKARAIGVTVVRAWAFDDRPEAPSAIQVDQGLYNEPGFAALDMVIARAGEHGIKVLLPLVGAGDTLGGVRQYLVWNGYPFPIPEDRRRFFVDGPVRDHFKSHVRFLLNRINTVNGIAYRNDPAIFGWEVVAGLDAAGLFDPAGGGGEVAEFFGELTAVIRSVDPNHVIGTGEAGFDTTTEGYGEGAQALVGAGLGWLFDGSRGISFSRNIRLEACDFATVHLTPSRWGFPVDRGAELGTEWIDAHGRLAAIDEKPLVVVRAALDGGLPLEARRQAFEAWLGALQGAGLQGLLLGSFDLDADARAADPTSFGPDDANPYQDLIEAAAQSLR